MDYQDIYKRGLAAGIEKGKDTGAQSARDEIIAGVSDIMDKGGDHKMKLSAILDYLKIDNNIEETEPAPQEGGKDKE